VAPVTARRRLGRPAPRALSPCAKPAITAPQVDIVMLPELDRVLEARLGTTEPKKDAVSA
jgi:hypothetical protein